MSSKDFLIYINNNNNPIINNIIDYIELFKGEINVSPFFVVQAMKLKLNFPTLSLGLFVFVCLLAVLGFIFKVSVFAHIASVGIVLFMIYFIVSLVVAFIKRKNKTKTNG